MPGLRPRQADWIPWDIVLHGSVPKSLRRLLRRFAAGKRIGEGRLAPTWSDISVRGNQFGRLSRLPRGAREDGKIVGARPEELIGTRFGISGEIGGRPWTCQDVGQ